MRFNNSLIWITSLNGRFFEVKFNLCFIPFKRAIFSSYITGTQIIVEYFLMTFFCSLFRITVPVVFVVVIHTQRMRLILEISPQVFVFFFFMQMFFMLREFIHNFDQREKIQYSYSITFHITCVLYYT